MKKKIYLELGLTLIIGFLLGFFVNSNITGHRMKDFSMHQGETIFWERALVEINATTEQEELINPIIRKYSDKTRNAIHDAWRQLPPIWDQMDSAIMEILTPEQQVQMKAIQATRKEHIEERIRRPTEKNPKKRGNKNKRGKEKKRNKTEHGPDERE